MKFIADLQIHSKYSRATSKEMILEEIDRWAADKGIFLMGTGDFTHPAWFRELREKLEPAEPGLFRLKATLKRPTISGRPADTRFMLTAETSHIYSRGGRVHRVHNLMFAPDFQTVEKINGALSRIGNLKSDGRPILGLDSRDLVKIALGANDEAVVIPAHAWTPWFSVFGSMSGFDSLEDCYGEYAKYIFAIETGLSSDPPMNWRLSRLDRISLISNSDSHSLRRIGREANVFDIEPSYQNVMAAIRDRDPKRFAATIEFFPEEGKYHFDGHRVCGVTWSPEETKKRQGRCPKCGRPVTVGVLSRVEALADRPAGYKDPGRVPFVSLVTLDQIVAEALGVGVQTKAVKNEYQSLIRKFGSELSILLNLPIGDLSDVSPVAAEGVRRVRAGELQIKPGYDGEYGEVSIFSDADRQKIEPQAALF